MKIVDQKKSERGPQRRTANGRLLHACCICGKVEVWSESWSAYYSWRELDDDVPIPKFCSNECGTKGGPDAMNVSEEMKTAARELERRPPKVVYREATEAEKYRAAMDQQAPRRPR